MALLVRTCNNGHNNYKGARKREKYVSIVNGLNVFSRAWIT